ncbi:MAG: LamG domain-containing protein [Sphingobacteriia bacterium]|jgi:hypothetical protein
MKTKGARLFMYIITGMVVAPYLVIAQGPGGALNFEGTSRVAVAYNLAGHSHYTISAWTKASIVPSGTSHYDQRHVLNLQGTAMIYGDINGQWRMGFMGSDEIWHGAYIGSIEPGVWEHLSLVFDRTAGFAFMYRNGNLISSLQLPAGILPVVPPWQSATLANHSGIGAGEDLNTKLFRGDIDEVRIWSRALTQDEIRHKMCEKLTGTEPGLVAYYRMDEGADNTCPGGQDVCDASGNGNHGIKF